MVTALFSWTGIVMILPNLTTLAIKSFDPVPSYSEVNARIYTERQKIVNAELALHPEIRSVFESPTVRDALARMYHATQTVTDDYFAHVERQLVWARRLAVLAPAGAAEFSTSDLAGTGSGMYQIYIDQVKRERNRVLMALQSQLDDPGATSSLESALEEANSQACPSQPLASSISDAVVPLVSMTAWFVLIAVLVNIRFQHYDLR
jgi:hypothetical protein